MKDFIVQAYVRGAAVGSAERTSFEANTAVFTKRRHPAVLTCCVFDIRPRLCLVAVGTKRHTQVLTAPVIDNGRWVSRLMEPNRGQKDREGQQQPYAQGQGKGAGERPGTQRNRAPVRITPRSTRHAARRRLTPAPRRATRGTRGQNWYSEKRQNYLRSKARPRSVA